MSKPERRAHKRKRVMFGAEAKSKNGIHKGVVRNFSEAGACVEFAAVQAPRDEVDLTVPRKGRAYKAKVVWTRENKAGVAFQSDAPSVVPDDDLVERLRRKERQVRVLRNRVRELTGG